MVENTYNSGQESGAADSSVINELRKQNRELAKRIAEAEQSRATAVEEMLASRGFGKLAPVFMNQVEGYPTAEQVEEFLADLGLQAKNEEVPVQEESVEEEKSTEPSASELGQQVASAAGSDSQPDIMKMLNEASSQKEIDKIMEDAGLTM